MALFEVLNESRSGGLPAQPIASDRARRRGIHGPDQTHPAEVIRRVLGRNRSDGDVQMPANDLGDGALRRRGVRDPAATLTAEASIAVLKWPSTAGSANQAAVTCLDCFAKPSTSSKL